MIRDLAKRKTLTSAMLDAIVVALVLATYFYFILPCQTYLSQGDLFGFSFKCFCRGYAVRAVFAFLFLVGVFLIIRPVLGRMICVIGLGAVILAMLQAGPLSIGLPELNGQFAGYDLFSRKILECMILLGAAAVLWLSRRIIARNLHLWSSIILLFGALSLLDVKCSKKKSDGDSIVPAFVPRHRVVESVRYAGKDNLFLLVLDSFNSDVAVEIFDSDPHLRKQYAGFTCYTNNIGMQWYTSLALPAIMTGRFITSTFELGAYGKECYGSNSLLKEYLAADIPTYVNISLTKDGYTNRLLGKSRAPVQDMSSRMVGTFNWNVAELSVFRILPYVLKKGYVKSLLTKWGGDGDSKDFFSDRVLWPLLCEAGVDSQYEKALHIHHTRGGHAPYVYDRNGQPQNEVNMQNFDAHLSQCHYSLKQVGAFLQKLRDKGVYENSTIFVVADHGYPVGCARNDGLPMEAHALMMVKAKGDVSNFRMSGKPTSHMGIAAVFRLLAAGEVPRAKIEKLLCPAKRICKACMGSNILTYFIDSRGNVTKEDSVSAEPEESQLEALSENSEYDFCISELRRDYPSFRVENGSRSGAYGVSPAGKPMRLVIRVPRPDAAYDVKFVASFRKRDKLRYRDGLRETLRTNDTDKWTDIILTSTGLKPDGRSLLHFEFENANGDDLFVIRRMTLTVGTKK